MAAITTLGNVDSLPVSIEQASVPTTWQEFTLPVKRGGARQVSVYGSGALYVAFSADGAADGGAVSTTRRAPVPATTWATFTLPRSTGRAASSIFVAAQASTATVNLTVEG